jgi:hypothetical protein
LTDEMQTLPGDVERAVQIGVQDCGPLRRLHLRQGLIPGDAGAVDQDLHCPELRFDLLRHGRAALERGDVTLDQLGLMTLGTPLPLPGPGQLCFSGDMSCHHGVSSSRQLPADLGADSSGPSSDESEPPAIPTGR